MNNIFYISKISNYLRNFIFISYSILDFPYWVVVNVGVGGGRGGAGRGGGVRVCTRAGTEQGEKDCMLIWIAFKFITSVVFWP